MKHAEVWLRGAMGVAVVALGLWVASCTEWVEKDVHTPARGEALTNPMYAADTLARRLGARTARPTGLAQLPPAGATLWLTSWHWDLFPENAQRLQAWVRGGGHLVMSAQALDGESLAWVPVDTESPDDDEDSDDSDDEANADATTLPTKKPAHPCTAVVEPDTLTPAFGERRVYRLCNNYPTFLRPQPGAKVLWSVNTDGTGQSHLLRVAVGRGSVTLVDAWGTFENDKLFLGDHPALLAAALQLKRGHTVWFVTEESRAALPMWLWQQAAVVVVAAALALAFALWRGAARFGPQVAVVNPARRSMAEQVSGTAGFLRLWGAGALHTAQRRVLDDTARTLLPQYTTRTRSERAELLARATGLDASALASALDPSLHPSPGRSPPVLAATLELLETARRRLVQAARDRTLQQRLATPSATSQPPDSPSA